jgi:Kef-type K+ transport system membrane component KefB
VSAVQLAAVLAAVVLVASIVSVELGVTVALLEMTLGVVAGNAFHPHTHEWLDFIAKFASIVLTFLAGMEVDRATCGGVSRLRSGSASSRSWGRSRSLRSLRTSCSIGASALP